MLWHTAAIACRRLSRRSGAAFAARRYILRAPTNSQCLSKRHSGDGDGELITFFFPLVINVIRLLSHECGSEPRSVHTGHDCLDIKLHLRVQIP
jgi:hypothetical protein